MARKNQAQIEFDALSVEGALLPAEWLAKVAALEAPAQSGADYGIPRGLQLRDEIGRYWRIAEAIWADFAAARAGADPCGAVMRLVHDLLMHVFGFSDLATGGDRIVGGRAFHIAFEAHVGHVPVVVGPPTDGMDQSVPRHGDGTRRRSAWGSLQEYLNAADDVLWGIATNGLLFRLGRDNASLTRPAWIEVDLERIFTEQRFADFAVCWLLIHASRFGRSDQAVQEAPLEMWREAGREEGTRARDALRVGVEEALLTLGQGFLSHPANTPLREALAAGTLTPAAYFNELLRLVYRMIFVLAVEERGILHAPGAAAGALALYAEGYSVRRLRERSLRHTAHDRHTDLWLSLRPVFSALGRAEGEAALGLPGLGGLFSADQCAHIDAAALENRALLTAVFRLAWLRQGGALAKVNWKDMGVEEFGSVYESLLELVPVVSEGGRRFGFAGGGETAGNARKLSGSYYTPDALVQQLLDTALEPVVAKTLSPHVDPTRAENALLSLAVVDPACGSGHFLIAAARRLAGHVARLRAGGTPGADEYRHALRDVVTHCIHGVDRNPMALELARMALWLEAYTPDRALGFLDHHLVCGDALIGLLSLDAVKDGIPDEAFKALSGDDKDAAKLLTKLNRAGRKTLEERRKRQDLGLTLGTQSLGEEWAALDALSDEGLAGVEAKRAAYARLRAEADADLRALAADIFVGAFLLPKTLIEGERALTEIAARSRFPSTSALISVLDGTMPADHTVVQAVRRVCEEANVLHWPLAFPQVFARGGFDIVLGNPPWERIKLQEQEFFAQRAPQVARARNKAERERQIAALAAAPNGTAERLVYETFLRAKRLAEATSVFCHSEARYPLTGVGDVNTYALFAETMYSVVGADGRAGLVAPTGIATDDSTKLFFQALVDRERLASLISFYEIRQWFPGTDDRKPFCLLTIAASQAARFVFDARSLEDARDVRKAFSLRASDFRLINPNTRTCPVFRSNTDALLTTKIYGRVPVLVDESRQSTDDWSVSFQRMFDMSNDSQLFTDFPEQDRVPLYEGKLIYQFDHRAATYEPSSAPDAEPTTRELLAIEKSADVTIQPRYWVHRDRVEERLAETRHHGGWLLGWRDITNAASERTTIASVLPRVAVGNNLPLLFTDAGAEFAAALLANLNAVVLDYVARHKVGGIHMNYFVLKQLPILPPKTYTSESLGFVVPRVLELTYTSADLGPWSRDLGFDGPPFPWDARRRSLLRAELDAWYARAYGLTRDELRYILDPADVMGSDWPSETFRVLKNNEEREFGEYRTRRLVLEAWDALAAGRPMPSDVPHGTSPTEPSADGFTGPPAVAPEAARAMAVLALVRAAGAPLAVPELARALALRARPSEVFPLVPPALAADVAAWSRGAADDPLPAGALTSLLDQLVDSEALEWRLAAGAPRKLVASVQAPKWEDLLPWYRDEASLLLRVLAALPADARAAIDASIPAPDRARISAQGA